MLIALWGGCLLCAHMLSALNINSLSLGKAAIDVKEGEALFIPCHYDTDKDGTDSKENPRNVLVEWGHFESSNGLYTPVIRVLNSYLEAMPDPNPYADRALMFLSLFNTGSCSLVVNPTFKNDSGTYEVKVFFNGQLYQKSPTIEVHIIANPARRGVARHSGRRHKHKRKLKITHTTTRTKTVIRPFPEYTGESVPPREFELPLESKIHGPTEAAYEDLEAESHQKTSEANEKAKIDKISMAKQNHPPMHDDEEEMYPLLVEETKHRATGKSKSSAQGHSKKRRQGLAAQNENESADTNGLEKNSQVPVMAIIYIALAIALLFFLGCVIGCIFCIIYIRRENHKYKKNEEHKEEPTVAVDHKETQSFDDLSSVGSAGSQYTESQEQAHDAHESPSHVYNSETENY